VPDRRRLLLRPEVLQGQVPEALHRQPGGILMNILST
jgi:hypothetical protein